MSVIREEERVLDNDHELDDSDQDLDDLNLIPLPDGEANRKPLLTLEPLVFLIFFAVNLSTSIYTNNLLYQICVFNLHEERSVCKYLGTANETEAIRTLEVDAQKYSADILMVTNVFTNVVPALWSFFLGPWSDKFGRKPIFISTMAGFTLQYVIAAAITYLSASVAINPWWYLLTIIPLMFTGGYCSLITVLFCYITDITNESNRSTRMIALETALYLGLFLGSLSSSQILNYMDAATVFAVCGGLCGLAFLYVIFYIQESVVVQSDPAQSKIRELFRFNHLSDMVEAACRRRADWCRCIVWLLFLSMSLVMFQMEGSSTVFFLFVREKFGWTVHDYALYDSMSILVQVFATIIGIYGLKKLCHISDPMMAVIASASLVLDGVTKSVAQVPADLYLAICLSLFKSILSPMCRSVISSVVANDEVGKLFALVTSLESLTPLIASPLYSRLYKATITTLPNAFNILSGSLGLLCTLTMTTVYVLMQGLPQVTYGSISS